MILMSEEVQKKWTEVLEIEDLPPIKDRNRRAVTAQLLENTERELGIYHDHSQFLLSENGPTNSMGTSSSTAGSGNIDTFDPIIMSLLRRSMPNLIAYELAGVQAMTGPTGLIFAMRTRYANQAGNEALFFEPNTAFSARGGANVSANSVTGYTSNTTIGGAATNINPSATITTPGFVNTTAAYTSNLAGNGMYNFGGGLNTFTVEGLGQSGNNNAIFPEMAFSIEKVTVTAKSRALKAEYSMELAQDLKALHGLDAESELSNILSAEILAEINREVVRTINVTAVPGSQTNVTTAGVFDLDTDSNGRWMVEKFKGMHFQLARECNQLAKDTRRGKGNVMICTSDVASALQMAGVLDYTPALNNNLQVDDTGNTFAGVLNGQVKVFIDPYALGGNYWTIGYKGANPFDAGLFYCPYVPLQMVRAVDPNTFQPKIAFKTRYGMEANPYATGGLASGGINSNGGVLLQDSNLYYRRTIVQNIM